MELPLLPSFLCLRLFYYFQMKHILLPVAVLLAAVVVACFFLSSKNHASSWLMDDGGDQEEILVDGGAVGPESLAFDVEGEGPYTGVSDGRILKWQGDGVGWTDFASVSPPHMLNECRGSQDPKREPLCGRPLGLCFNKKTGQLYIADAYFGLLMVDYRDKVATTVSMEAGGATFYFTNSLDIDHNSGVIYFTDSSQKFRRREFLSAIITGDNTGRLMRYDPTTKEVQILLDGLSFPNGVALSSDSSFLLIAETSTCRILKYWLNTSKNSSIEVLLHLPGFPDNIKRSPRGGFWVALHSRKGKLMRWLLSLPRQLRNAFSWAPFEIHDMILSTMKMWKKGGMALRVGEDGEVLQVLEILGGKRMVFISEVHEQNGTLWTGSVTLPAVGRYTL